MDKELSRIITVLMQKHQIDISAYDKAFLLKSIERRQLEIGACNASEYIVYLEKDRSEAEALYSSLHISFSQFFRDPVTFAVLEQSIFPAILANKQNGSEIRIWSAGCANGQEAYSIAILLSELINTWGKEIRFRIFATDTSQEAISMGRTGTYDESMILEVKIKHLKKYFIQQDKNYTIIPQLQKHINFSTYDLLDQSTANMPDSIYGDFDVVMCSNVLIYYNHEMQINIIKKLQQALSPTGYLVTSESEKTLVQNETKMHMFSSLPAIFKNNEKI